MFAAGGLISRGGALDRRQEKHQSRCQPINLVSLLLACFFLVTTVLPTSATASVANTRFGEQTTSHKAKLGKAVAKERDCRKRVLAGKTVPLDGASPDMAAIEPHAVGGLPASAYCPQPAMLFALRIDGVIRALGARAPPHRQS
jgi:hypothetical protein